MPYPVATRHTRQPRAAAGDDGHAWDEQERRESPHCGQDGRPAAETWRATPLDDLDLVRLLVDGVHIGTTVSSSRWGSPRGLHSALE